MEKKILLALLLPMVASAEQPLPQNPIGLLKQMGKRFATHVFSEVESSPESSHLLGNLSETQILPSGSVITTTSTARPLSLEWSALLLKEPLHKNHRAEFFIDGSEFYPVRRRMIQEAMNTIDIITYLWCDDESGLAIAQDLADAAERGVRVRVMIEFLNFIKDHKKAYAILKKAGIVPLEYNPPSWGISELFEHALHEKIMLVDGAKLLTGGANICDEYMIGGKRGLWHDLEIFVEGPVASALQRRVDSTWNWMVTLDRAAEESSAQGFSNPVGFPITRFQHSTFRAPTPTPDWSSPDHPFARGITAVVPQYQQSYRDRREGQQQRQAFIKMIEAAQKSIIVYAPYYLLEPSFEKALHRASRERKVKVTVFTNSPKTNDEAMSKSIAVAKQGSAFYGGLILREFQTRTLHAKALLIDEKLLSVGSHNFTGLSFEKNGELNLLLDDPAIIKKFTKMIESDSKEAPILTFAQWKARVDDTDEQFDSLFSGFIKGLID